MPGSHHPRSAVEHRAEVVPVPQFGLAGRQPHPHRQLQRPLRSDRSVDSALRRRERGGHAVTGVAEQKTVVRLDRGAQRLVVREQGQPHPIRVGLPPTGRTLNRVNRKVTPPTGQPPSWHRLGPRDMPFEAELCGHRAIAIPIVAIGGVVAVGPG